MSGKKKAAEKTEKGQKPKGVDALPEELKRKHTRVEPPQTTTPEFHGLYRHLDIDNQFDLASFHTNFRVEVRSMGKEDMVFDLIGIDAPVANAFRRVVISEVATMAIETVFIHDNTSIMQDEVLAHRLGLIPINVDPRLFDFKTGSEHTEQDTLVFKLDKKCTRSPGAKETDPEEVKYDNSRVYSGDLKWEPQGDQQTKFPDGIKMVHENILLCKLRPGQSIVATCFCHKGVGKDHAKFSPVATASYRLLPEIELLPIEGGAKKKEVPFFVDDMAQKLVDKCPMKVFDIEEMGGQKRAVVASPENCSMCRECIRDPVWDKQIKLRRVRNHYIFSIETTGALKPKEIFEEAVMEFMKKINMMRTELAKLKSHPDSMEADS